MSDRLDLVLEAVREPEPSDEGFIHLVMRDVRADEQRRVGRRALRRPFVIGLAAAAVVTGSAVAAVVGTNPPAPEDVAKPPAVTARVIADEPAPASASATEERDTPQTDAPRVDASDAPADTADALTDHTSSVTDENTGLRLDTETYSNAFTVSEPQRVTLTISNTGRYPITVSGARGCTMQVMAVPEGEDPTVGLAPSAWSCAGSEEDPRIQAAEETIVLAPGEKRSADAMVTLRRAGEWELTGICRCSYSQVKPTPVPRDGDLLTDLSQRSLSSPLLPQKSEGQNLTTPAIRLRAD